MAAALAQPARTPLLANPLASLSRLTLAPAYRKGCPLSGGAFSLATLPMLRALASILGEHRMLGYAGDRALVIPSVTLLPRVAAVLDAMTRAAGLRLNIAKCCCVPMHAAGDGGAGGLLSAAIAATHPAWADIRVAQSAMFSGTMFAPTLEVDALWAEAAAKHRHAFTC